MDAFVLYDDSASPRANYERLTPVIWLPEYAEPLAAFVRAASNALRNVDDETVRVAWRDPIHAVLFALAARPTRKIQERFAQTVRSSRQIEYLWSDGGKSGFSSPIESPPEDLYESIHTFLRGRAAWITSATLRNLRFDRDTRPHAKAWKRLRALAIDTWDLDRPVQETNKISLEGGLSNAIDKTVNFLFSLHELALRGKLPSNFVYLTECAQQNVNFLEALASLQMDSFLVVMKKLERPKGKFGYNLNHVRVLEVPTGHRLFVDPPLRKIARGIGRTTGMPQLQCPGMNANIGNGFDPDTTAVIGLLDTVLYAFDRAGIWRNDPRLQPAQLGEPDGSLVVAKSFGRKDSRS